MTNYDKFPYWRAKQGITIKFNENTFSWTIDNINQRNYLTNSTYLDGSIAIYIGRLNLWLSVDNFKRYCIDENYRNGLKIAEG
jgi:hypothetical protein